MSAEPWWKSAVAYQVYPRSFMDSNGDGIGDLNGIISRSSTTCPSSGIDVVWLSPHFDSPNADNGYDIRDYRAVMAEFGTMDDFDRLLAGLTERGIRLIIDLVVNHSSGEHQWFVESRVVAGQPLPRLLHLARRRRRRAARTTTRRSSADRRGRSTTTTGQYYLHYFADSSPTSTGTTGRCAPRCTT